MLISKRTKELLSQPSTLIREVRDPQVKMGELVSLGLENGKNVIVEAGTGVGKSFAYLIPALLLGKEGRKTVVSTATKGLQAQLIEKDLPYLCQGLNLDVPYALVKSARNYLCPLTLEKTETAPRNIFDYKKQVLKGANIGEVWQMGLTPQQIDNFCAENCIGRKCQHSTGCEYSQVKKRVQVARVLVTNHHALARHLYHDSTTLGSFQALVLDEAHKAVSAFRASLGTSLHDKTMDRFLSNVENLAIPSIYQTQWQGLVPRRGEIIDLYTRLFGCLPKPEKDFVELNKRVVRAGYTNLFPKFKDATSPLIEALDIDKIMREMELRNIEPDKDDLMKINKASKASKRLSDIQDTFGTVDRLIGGPDDPSSTLCYVEKGFNKSSVLVKKPFDVDFLLSELAVAEVPVVLTSATLAVGNDFESSLTELGVKCEKEYQAILGSPYDVNGRSVLYLPFPEVFPEPPGFSAPKKVKEDYNIGLCKQIEQVTKGVDGHVFCLFTAKYSLEQAYWVLRKKLKGYTLLAQREGMPAGLLLEEYKQAWANGDKPVLLGLKSFWEGVSMDGDLLRAVIITKLPFPSISTPEFSAYSKKYGSEAFMRYSMPEVTKDLKQGLGRLIRTKTDYGLLAILDSRTLVKNYRGILKPALPTRRTRDLDKAIRAYQDMREAFK